MLGIARAGSGFSYFLHTQIILIFAAVVMATSPVLATGLDVNGAETEIEVNIPEVMSLAVEKAFEGVNLEVEPTPGGRFASEATGVLAGSNLANGYRIMINTADSDTDMRSPSAIVTTAIRAATAEMTAESVSGWWGYSTDGVNFLGVPAAGLPGSIVKNNTRYNDATDEGLVLDDFSVTFGTKVDSSMAAGYYSNTVVFTMIANE